MSLTLAEINRVTLRVCAPFFEHILRNIGMKLPTPWCPTDEELARIAESFSDAIARWEGEV